MLRYTTVVFTLFALSAWPLVSHAQIIPAAQLETAVNQARVSAGVPALAIDSRLEVSAAAKIVYMQTTGCYLPRCVNEPNAYQRQLAAGYPSTGFASELIDPEHDSVADVVSAWTIEGSGDRFLLTLGAFTDLGCATGLEANTGQVLWVCDLGQQVGAVIPTATLVPTFTTQVTSTRVPPTATGVPATATGIPATATPPPTDELGECAHVWYNPTTGGSAARFIGRTTQFACVGF